MHWKTLFDFFGNPVIAIAAVAAGAAMAALLLQIILTKIITRLIAHHAFLRAFLSRSVKPTALLLPTLAIQAVLAAAPGGDEFKWVESSQQIVLVLSIAGATWLVSAAILGLHDVAALRFPIATKDNLHARRVLTQATVLTRVGCGIVILIGVAIALTTLPGVRQIGASLLASAGLAGIVVGFAARPVLGNLIAGLQIALSQPIRIDDVVIVEGEWGRVEDITGAFVVVKIWDERRLIVPLQWFIEHPFQNWTHTGANIIGTVFLWVDYRLGLESLREELKRICEASPEWDKRVMSLQVTDANERAMQIRIIASSADAGANWDLKCRIREGLIAYIQRNHGDALPHLRAQLVQGPPSNDEKVEPRDSNATAKGKATPELA